MRWGGARRPCSLLRTMVHTGPQARSRRTCVYLSMNMSALGTLWSPRCTTEDPTHEPMRAWTLGDIRERSG